MVDPKTIAHIGTLARLTLNEKETQDYSQTLSKVMTYFEQISKVPTDGIEPLVTPTDLEIFWRADEQKSENTAEEMLANAPEKTGNLFTVPPVV